ncbi:aminodeoxyfutalosine deaminase [Friedmanniella luteola]|uniref:Aminodeoxyfutalosine deaminase n=1 Tax=Friedmanniella luteola TaxID=546871 RepID=A0A1H1L3W5_9ACTN|nr:adenosine deaminase [Friedmanniella luteola]SDR68715.1 aminodeoxyfutalosine deaminase [Friedmanniella luteola]
MEEFIAGLPKAELHVHHVGSASPRIVAELAARHPGTVPTDPAELARFFVFEDFPHFIRTYLAVVDLVRTAEDVRLLTYEVARDMAAQNIRYAELTVTPCTSVTDALPVPAFLEALEDARTAAARDLGLELRWIFDIPADFGLPAAELTASAALDHDVPGLVGFGVGGSEVGFPRSMFRDQFDRARAAGLHSVPHAGETTGPETIWDAVLNLGAERVEHGITAVGDPALLAHLAEHGVVLDVCPTSNVALGVVPSLAAHPLPALVAAGVRVTVNTDDPPMFGTDLDREYAIAADLLGLDEAGVADLALAAVDGSFAPDATRAALRAEISAYAARATPPA